MHVGYMKSCLQTFRNNRICLKLAYFLRNLQASRANNSRILRIKVGFLPSKSRTISFNENPSKIMKIISYFILTLSWRRPLSYRNQFIDLLYKSMDWFLDNISLRHERVKSSFRSQDIQIFVLTFWSCRTNGLIRKIRLISKFLTLQPG